MQTKETVFLGFIPAIVDAYEADNVKNGRPYKDRILAAGVLVEQGHVSRVAKGEYDVLSSGEGTRTYHVNGTCSCPDGKVDEQGVSKAPHAWCKHRMAVRIFVKVEAKLKELTDLSVPHPHTWNCEAHRDLPIECWTRCCPDPLKIPCATCAAITHTDESEPPFITIDETTGEIHEETPTMMTTIGETVKQVITFAPLSTNGETPETEPPCREKHPGLTCAEYENGKLDSELHTDQYEPAPVILPDPVPLPEAPVSLCLTIKIDRDNGITYTMRGADDVAVLERLPLVLATMERLLHAEVDHEAGFLTRIKDAFFPKKKQYTGK